MSLLIKTRSLQIAGIDVTVRDLPWPAMKQFMDRLSRHVKALIAETVRTAAVSEGPAAAATLGAGFLEQLPALITNSVELAEYLVTKTTNRDAAWLQDISSTEFMALLDASLEVVFNDELVKMGKAAGGRVAVAFNLGNLTALSPKASTSSSPRAGHTRTPVDSPSPKSNSGSPSSTTDSSPAKAPSPAAAA